MIRSSRDPFGASCPVTFLVKGHDRTVASRALLYLEWILEWISVAIAILPLASLRANSPPNTPVISEPATEGQIVNPGDVHMETRPFSDPDPGDTHLCSDWEIWTVTPSQRVWLTACIGGAERIHTHLGDDVFRSSHAGRTELFPDTDYRLRVRHRDSSGHPAPEWSAWAKRGFRTVPNSQVFPRLLHNLLA